METTHALKEWQVAVDALSTGKTVILLRKGGIREVGGRFSVAHDRVLLYPTYEHQKPHLLQPEYAHLVTPVESGWHPETIEITAWADITDTLQVTDPKRVEALLPFLIWNEAFISDRLNWKPNQPLYVLLLRVHQLAEPKTIPYDSAYGGCKSWIDLLAAISLEGKPTLSDQEYHQRVEKIYAAIA